MAEDEKRSDDDLAADYVLGVLEAELRAETAARIERDGDFARLVATWEQRLSGFNEDYAEEAPPPGAKRAIDARLFGESEPARSAGLSRWLGWAAGGLAAAVAVALVVMVWLPGSQDRLVAELAGDGSPYTFQVTVTDDTADVVLVTGERPDGQDLEVWVIAGDKAPVSLGLMREGSVLRNVDFEEGYVIAVSLEPAGGSPTGAPTGPVVAAGPLIKI